MILQTCKIHGDLSESDILKEKRVNAPNGFYYRCRQCRLDKNRLWKLNNIEKHRASAGRARKESRRLYREGLSKEIPKANLWIAKDRKENPEKHKNWAQISRKKAGQLRNTREVCRKVKIDISYYYKMLEKQKGLCAICLQPETRASRTPGKTCQLAIDHDHKTGRIRELLCHDCNVGIGHFNDSIGILKNAIEYLKKHSE